MDEKYKIENDQYCYMGTSVLRNKYDIFEKGKLDTIETLLVSEKMLQLEMPILSRFKMDDHLNIHKHLFSGLYEWAGCIRKCDISKANSRFCNWNYILKELKKLENKWEFLLEDTEIDIHEKIASLYGDINVIHPFRDGNGRTTRLHIETILASVGYSIDWCEVDESHWIEACIHSFHGNDEMLSHIFKNIISIYTIQR